MIWVGLQQFKNTLSQQPFYDCNSLFVYHHDKLMWILNDVRRRLLLFVSYIFFWSFFVTCDCNRSSIFMIIMWVCLYSGFEDPKRKLNFVSIREDCTILAALEQVKPAIRYFLCSLTSYLSLHVLIYLFCLFIPLFYFSLFLCYEF